MSDTDSKPRYGEPNQQNAPFTDDFVACIETTAKEMVKEHWLDGALLHDVGEPSLTSGSELYLEVAVSFTGYLSSPEPVDTRLGRAWLGMVGDEGTVYVEFDHDTATARYQEEIVSHD